MLLTQFNKHRSHLLLAGLMCLAGESDAQSMAESIRQPWQAYVFVSTQMPRESLVHLAREVADTSVVLVLNGFGAQGWNMASTERFIREINERCCSGKRVTWQINPKLFQTFRIRSAPTFALARAGVTDPSGYSLVAGDMSLANALKFMAQESQEQAIRLEAAKQYRHLFARGTD